MTEKVITDNDAEPEGDIPFLQKLAGAIALIFFLAVSALGFVFNLMFVFGLVMTWVAPVNGRAEQFRLSTKLLLSAVFIACLGPYWLPFVETLSEQRLSCSNEQVLELASSIIAEQLLSAPETQIVLESIRTTPDGYKAIFDLGPAGVNGFKGQYQANYSYEKTDNGEEVIVQARIQPF